MLLKLEEKVCLWRLFSVADESIFGAVVSVSGRRMVCMGLEYVCVCFHGDEGT